MWQWNQNDEQHSWWKAPTIMNHPSDKPWDDPNGSSFWKSIGQLQAHFNCSVRTQLGNGINTKFWHDKWLGTVLKEEYPNLYSLATNKRASISQCISPSGWFLHVPDLNTSAQSELPLLLAQLQQVSLPLAQHQDEISWVRSSGPFTASSAYKFISHTPSPFSSLHNIWIIKAPLRILIFAWLLLSNSLTTVDNLARRGWSLPNICMMCRAATESTLHLFTQCSVAKHIRAYICAVVPSTTHLPMKFTTSESLLMLIDSKENATARNWEITTCYIIWRERCRRIFSDKELPHLANVREIMLEFRNWFQS